MIQKCENLKDIITYYANRSARKPVIGFRKNYSYEDLNIEIERLGNTLKSKGLAFGKRIGIWLPNSDSFVIALFAIFYIQSCGVLLSSLLNIKELLAYCRHSEISALLVTNRQFEQLVNNEYLNQLSILRMLIAFDDIEFNNDKIRFHDIHRQKKYAGGYSVDGENRDSQTENAIIMYTSGTTGKQKAVVLSHRNLIANAMTTAGVLKINASDRALIVMPMCHAYALTRQLLSHLAMGAFIQISPHSLLPDVINHTIDSRKLTTFSGIPYLLKNMFKRGAGRKYLMKSLKTVTIGTATMLPEMRANFVNVFPSVNFYSTYGLTEAGSLVAVLPEHLFLEKPFSVGRAIPGVECKIIDENQSDDHPDKAIGELLVRGPSVMRSYYKNPQTTQEVMDSDGWLHTGDLVSIDQEGDITICGRKKELIKCAGENIFPAEVEAVLAEYHGVKEVCVIGIPDIELGEATLAVIVPENSNTDKTEIMRFCEKNLAVFKQPKDIIFIDSIARNHVGKVKKDIMFNQYMRSIHRV